MEEEACHCIKPGTNLKIICHVEVKCHNVKIATFLKHDPNSELIILVIKFLVNDRPYIYLTVQIINML